MTDPQVAPEWMAQVQETFLKLRSADRKAQEDACNVIGELPDGGEAAATLMELFETERA
jgi:hypothetical protein